MSVDSPDLDKYIWHMFISEYIGVGLSCCMAVYLLVMIDGISRRFGGADELWRQEYLVRRCARIEAAALNATDWGCSGISQALRSDELCEAMEDDTTEFYRQQDQRKNWYFRLGEAR